MRVAVLVPVKDFGVAKVRLAESLDPAARAALARKMATTVVRAADPLPVTVVCDTEDVREWAEELGAAVVWAPGRGLNGAVTDGVARLAELGFDQVVVAHADLPLATDLAWLGGFDGVTIVPDRRADGSNVVAVPANVGFTFAYGPGSYRKHREEALRLGLRLRIVPDAALGWDVDEPADLELPAAHP